MADERDPKVSQRYRELAAEEPSRELDQAILAAAHRAADKPHAPLVTPAGRHRWYFSLGAAAVIVLAVAVTWHVERAQPDPETVVLKEEVPLKESPAADEKRSAAAAVESPKPAAPALKPEPKPRLQQAPREFARDAAPAASAPAESRIRENAAGDVARAEVQQAPAPAPAPSAQAERGDERAAAGGVMSRRTDRVEPQAAPAPPTESRVQQDAAPQAKALGGPAVSAYIDSPERFLDRIAELRKEGRHNEADQLLAEFRQRYPDYRISKEMLEKVERKK
jgi:hypothetical protein